MPDHSNRRADRTPSGKKAKSTANCATCAAVCCRLIVVLAPEDNVPTHLTSYLPNGVHVMAHGEDGWCVALDRTHMNCGIYADRPSTCRRFVMGGPYCRAVRSDYAKQPSRSIDITLK
ncbi:YkgJ family cysteine cluster protein [Dyella choica]|uniref:YkgJ family cysteine cluster protein n=1 Tax=Dyella choica TaxID=1927959 RepID=A0A432M5Z6_9GAMM|nr:YkgJ family cysteine cluster protein [Dyella choica]RUL75940.1 YkgJ family cysteine cluster protein [Dyella choica]